MRGRPPKPTKILRLQGTFQPSRHTKRVDPAPPGDLAQMAPPDWMDEEQKAEWARVLPDVPPGVLKRINWQMYATFIEQVIRHRRAVIAQHKIDANSAQPFLLRGPNGVYVSPYIGIINRASDKLLRLANELGFTPSARARLIAQPEDEDENANDWGALRANQGDRNRFN